MERNVTLNLVRGVAILGIPLLNISAFGLPEAAYSSSAWYGVITLQDAWIWAFFDLIGQVKFLTLFASSSGAGLQMLLPRGRWWIQSRLTLSVLLGFTHGLLFWDGDILLAHELVGLTCWRLVRDAPSVKSPFNTGVMLYLVGLGVLLLLGLISDSQTSRAWIPDTSAILYEKHWKLHGGIKVTSNRADGVGNSLLVPDAQYGWQLVGMTLTGVALTRSGWLKGRLSLRHYRRTGFALAAIGAIINLPVIVLQQRLDWTYRRCTSLLQMPRELSAPFQAIGYVSPFYGFWPQLSRFKLVLAIACAGRMALTNYLLQTLVYATLSYRPGPSMQSDRLELLAFVIPVWLTNILFSVIWLRYSCQGPAEWLWRQLTLRAAGPTIPKTSR